MINTPIFTVTGNTDVDDDVIFCNRLVFVGVHPQLVIRRKKEIPPKPPGAQRLLKIVADTIDTQAASDPEITYNLADDIKSYIDAPGIANSDDLHIPDIQLPLGDSGLDPETQASPGKKGISDFETLSSTNLLPPEVASPNFTIWKLDPTRYIGVYPRAKDGGHGKPGAKGKEGVNGVNAPILEIWTKEIVGNNLTLDLRGQMGGIGGKGGGGQNGGDGQAGSVALPGVKTEVDIGGATLEAICVQEPGLGGDGGRGGDAGCGGDGGNGGNGGVVKVFYVNGVDLTKLTPVTGKGKGGKAGPAGTPGKGGKFGPAGLNVPPSPCPSALESYDGPDGNDCFMGEGHQGWVAQDGEDGKDGYFVSYMVRDIPQISRF